jgi:hypothetical protein
MTINEDIRLDNIKFKTKKLTILSQISFRTPNMHCVQIEAVNYVLSV